MSAAVRRQLRALLGANILKVSTTKKDAIQRPELFKQLAEDPRVSSALTTLLGQLDKACPDKLNCYSLKDPAMGDFWYVVKNWNTAGEDHKKAVRNFIETLLLSSPFSRLTSSGRLNAINLRKRFQIESPGGTFTESKPQEGGESYIGQPTPSDTGIRHETQKGGSVVVPSNLSEEMGKGDLEIKSHPDAFMSNQSLPIVSGIHDSMSDVATFSPGPGLNYNTQVTPTSAPTDTALMAKFPTVAASGYKPAETTNKLGRTMTRDPKQQPLAVPYATPRNIMKSREEKMVIAADDQDSTESATHTLAGQQQLNVTAFMTSGQGTGGKATMGASPNTDNNISYTPQGGAGTTQTNQPVNGDLLEIGSTQIGRKEIIGGGIGFALTEPEAVTDVFDFFKRTLGTLDEGASKALDAVKSAIHTGVEVGTEAIDTINRLFKRLTPSNQEKVNEYLHRTNNLSFSELTSSLQPSSDDDNALLEVDMLPRGRRGRRVRGRDTRGGSSLVPLKNQGSSLKRKDFLSPGDQPASTQGAPKKARKFNAAEIAKALQIQDDPVLKDLTKQLENTIRKWRTERRGTDRNMSVKEKTNLKEKLDNTISYFMKTIRDRRAKHISSVTARGFAKVTSMAIDAVGDAILEETAMNVDPAAPSWGDPLYPTARAPSKKEPSGALIPMQDDPQNVSFSIPFPTSTLPDTQQMDTSSLAPRNLGYASSEPVLPGSDRNLDQLKAELADVEAKAQQDISKMEIKKNSDVANLFKLNEEYKKAEAATKKAQQRYQEWTKTNMAEDQKGFSPFYVEQKREQAVEELQSQRASLKRASDAWSQANQAVKEDFKNLKNLHQQYDPAISKLENSIEQKSYEKPEGRSMSSASSATSTSASSTPLPDEAVPMPGDAAPEETGRSAFVGPDEVEKEEETDLESIGIGELGLGSGGGGGGGVGGIGGGAALGRAESSLEDLRGGPIRRRYGRADSMDMWSENRGRHPFFDPAEMAMIPEDWDPTEAVEQPTNPLSGPAKVYTPLLRLTMPEGGANIVNEVNSSKEAQEINRYGWLNFNNYAWEANDEADNNLHALNIQDETRRFFSPLDKDDILPAQAQAAVEETYNSSSDIFALPKRTLLDGESLILDTRGDGNLRPYSEDETDAQFHDVYMKPWIEIPPTSAWNLFTPIEGSQIYDSMLEDPERYAARDNPLLQYQNNFIVSTLE